MAAKYLVELYMGTAGHDATLVHFNNTLFIILVKE